MRIAHRASRREDAEGGFTLVELLVYIVLFAIVGTMVVMLVWNGYRTQLDVTHTTQNSGSTQNAITALNNDVRYASAVSIVAGGDILLTRTWVGNPNTGSYVCRGWFYDDSSNQLRRTQDAAETSGASAASAGDWSTYVNGVSAVEPFSSPDPGVVHVVFTGSPENWGRETDIDTYIRQRPQPDEESAPCF